jgi:hypothetical protein
VPPPRTTTRIRLCAPTSDCIPLTRTAHPGDRVHRHGTALPRRLSWSGTATVEKFLARRKHDVRARIVSALVQCEVTFRIRYHLNSCPVQMGPQVVCCRKATLRECPPPIGNYLKRCGQQPRCRRESAGD